MSDPIVFPIVFVIVLVCSLASVTNSGIFNRSSGLVISVCVACLSAIGIDLFLIEQPHRYKVPSVEISNEGGFDLLLVGYIVLPFAFVFVLLLLLIQRLVRIEKQCRRDVEQRPRQKVRPNTNNANRKTRRHDAASCKSRLHMTKEY